MKSLTAGVGAFALGALLLVPGSVLGSAEPRAQLRSFTCTTALNPPDRSVGVTAVMRPLAGTLHLQIRFDLLYAHGSGVPHRVLHAGDLGVWKKPPTPTLGQRPGDVWSIDKPVVELAAPDTYRFRVQFRWIGAGHQILGHTVRYSRRCRQPELRPDLLVKSIAVAPIAKRPAKNVYAARIVNSGNTAAGPFDVLFAPADGTGTITRTVPLLKPHSGKTMRFVGPVCSPSTVPTITVDSASQVDDLNRSNNALTAVCSPSGAG